MKDTDSSDRYSLVIGKLASFPIEGTDRYSLVIGKLVSSLMEGNYQLTYDNLFYTESNTCSYCTSVYMYLFHVFIQLFFFSCKL